ncbi:MAG: glucose-1-phosphate adenylyltransferase subunit GlgD, partial [Clostridia bacterium]|nr:glucose-1-phosphate adenylyltransferase subunit GlgD [Clostridia bacterium]
AQVAAGDLKIVGYEIEGFAEMIDSLKTYYDVSMELLKPENRKALLNPKNSIATKIADNVPTLYGENSKTGNSLIADGCTIEGTVENSLLFRGVVVEKGAVVKNSILMQGTVVHANATVNSIVTDKNVTISANRTLSGDPSYPIYFTKNIVV